MDRAATIIPLALARISIFWFILLAADYYSYDLHWAWDEPQAKSALIVPIEQVPLGSRISTKNPEAFGAENPIPDAHESTWRLLSAEIEREDGAQVEVELLRPVTWIEEQGFTLGARIYLRLEELNVAGWATIRAVDPCPPLSSGHGNLVTGRFVTRGVTNLVEATFSDGLNEPTVLNGTSIHPVWSLDRLDWVPLGELAIGEQVYSHDGPLSLVARTSRNQPTDVYNIEVDCEHVYQVGDAGILVHNTCAGYHHFAPRAWGSNVPYGPNYLKHLNATEHTDIHRAFSDFLKIKHGHYFNAKSGSWWQSNVSKFERIRTLIEFHRSYRGGHYYADFVNEVRAAMKAGCNPFG